jgi:hypothetical protein
MEDHAGPANAGSRSTLEAEQVRWEIDKLDAKRRLLEEVIGLVQSDRAVNAGVTRIVESMATLAERDPAPFWSERSAANPPSAAKLQFPSFPPFPFPLPPFPSLPGLPPFPQIPNPGDVFGQITDLIKAEKAMIQDLLKELLR